MWGCVRCRAGRPDTYHSSAGDALLHSPYQVAFMGATTHNENPPRSHHQERTSQQCAHPCTLILHRTCRRRIFVVFNLGSVCVAPANLFLIYFSLSRGRGFSRALRSPEGPPSSLPPPVCEILRVWVSNLARHVRRLLNAATAVPGRAQ